jgi:hypothetical protein
MTSMLLLCPITHQRSLKWILLNSLFSSQKVVISFPLKGGTLAHQAPSEVWVELGTLCMEIRNNLNSLLVHFRKV